MNIDNIKNELKNRLTPERFLHSVGVSETAGMLAEKMGEDKEKAILAGLLHDVAKCIPNDKLIEYVKENNLPISQEDLLSIKALHSPVGAYIAKNEFGINDQDIFNSIKNHTIGSINMSKLEKIVFLADKIEPYTRDKDFRDKVIHAINENNDLDAGLLICYESTIKSLVLRKMYINQQTINIWNNLILKLKK